MRNLIYFGLLLLSQKVVIADDKPPFNKDELEALLKKEHSERISNIYDSENGIQCAARARVRRSVFNRTLGLSTASSRIPAALSGVPVLDGEDRLVCVPRELLRAVRADRKAFLLEEHCR